MVLCDRPGVEGSGQQAGARPHTLSQGTSLASASWWKWPDGAKEGLARGGNQGQEVGPASLEGVGWGWPPTPCTGRVGGGEAVVGLWKPREAQSGLPYPAGCPRGASHRGGPHPAGMPRTSN